MSAKYYGTEKVGKTFEYNGKTYKVMDNRRKENVCLNCAFYEGKEAGCYEMACAPFLRDGKRGISVQTLEKYCKALKLRVELVENEQ